jgi:NADH-quinone oxidoreductase subunit A
VSDRAEDVPDELAARYVAAAAVFLGLDVVTVLLAAWALVHDRLALAGLVAMLAFVALFAVGYAYAWRRGAFDRL